MRIISDYKAYIKQQFEDNKELNNRVVEKHLDKIQEIVNLIIKTYKNNKKVLWFGNGGSAADAQHLACELVSKFNFDRKAIPSIALTTNTSILTAISNDYSFEKVFSRQVEGIAEKGDILIGISTSGTSKNVIEALKKGKEKGTINIAFIGNKKDKIKLYSDYLIDIPSNETPRIQEMHIIIGHIICDLVEKSLFGDK